MTELTIYRLNRIPDKLHVALLELLGIRLDPPRAAEIDLRFRLTGPAEEPVEIPRGATEVGTPRTASDEPIVFQTTEDFTIEPLRPAAYVLSRGSQVKNVAVADGVAKPARRRAARRSATRRSPATRCTSASTARSGACC